MNYDHLTTNEWLALEAQAGVASAYDIARYCADRAASALDPCNGYYAAVARVEQRRAASAYAASRALLGA